jgi:uncharacterized protein
MDKRIAFAGQRISPRIASKFCFGSPRIPHLNCQTPISWYARQAMSRLPPAILLVFWLLPGCQRAGNNARAEPVDVPVASVPPVSRPEPPTAPSCLVPLADAAPEAARPAKSCPLEAEPAPHLPRGEVKFLGGTTPVIEVELAVTSDAQQRGLMYRTHLAPESGMLFSWSNETVHTFWMHNTCIPLDMLFIAADGTILGILEQVPVLNDEPRSIRCASAHVLEVNAGYCRQHGITPGQRIRIKTS